MDSSSDIIYPECTYLELFSNTYTHILMYVAPSVCFLQHTGRILDLKQVKWNNKIASGATTLDALVPGRSRKLSNAVVCVLTGDGPLGPVSVTYEKSEIICLTSILM